MSRICIVGGCGHVGLPLGLFLAQNGFDVTLQDVNAASVELTNDGRMPFQERGADELLPELLAQGKIRAATDAETISGHDVVIVTVGTPVDEFLNPGVRAFETTLDTVFDRMRNGQLLVLRSTVFPSMTERLAARAARRGLDIDVAFCPERIAQGYALVELWQHPQIIAGTTPRATERAVELFSVSGVRLIELSPVEAELAKLFCNAYRYLHFAIANQFLGIAQSFGADFFRIHDAVTTEYPRMQSLPKPGFAGGPCLLKDTMQLAAFNHNSFVLGQAAMMVNEGLPRVVVDHARQQHSLRGSTAAILGMAFKGNCDDPRDSLSYKLWKLLELECDRVFCTDPHISDSRFVSLEQALKEADIVFLGACHDEYRTLKIDKPVVDVFGFLRTPETNALPARSGSNFNVPACRVQHVNAASVGQLEETRDDKNPGHRIRRLYRRLSGRRTAVPRLRSCRRR